jgi:hypothetical protein
MSVAPWPGAVAPDLIEPVLGFRQWRVDAGGLRSLHRGDRWPAATFDASCSLGAHPPSDAPVHTCSCGVHAWYEPTPRLASAGTADLVCGAVVLWGRIELHAVGMRGEHARVVALALPLGRGAKRRALIAAAARLGVPAVPYSAVAGLGARDGAPVPDVLKPGSAPASP